MNNKPPFTVHVKKPGGDCLFEGSYDACMTLAHAMEAFPQDVVRLEVVDDDADTCYKWLSPYWND
jgi:hypothetical protein